MKKLIATSMMLLFATSALATNIEFVLKPLSTTNRIYTEPCPQHPDAPVPANGYCSEGMVCPIGYDPVPKYCFRGGLHRCGITCQNNHMYDGGN